MLEIKARRRRWLPFACDTETQTAPKGRQTKTRFQDRGSPVIVHIVGFVVSKRLLDGSVALQCTSCKTSVLDWMHQLGEGPCVFNWLIIM